MDEQNLKIKSSQVSKLKLAAAFGAGVMFSGFMPFYDYSNFTTPNGASYPVRTHRITGRAESFGGSWEETNEGWVAKLFERSPSTPIPESVADKGLSRAEISKLGGQLALTNYGYIEADIYNGTDRVISSIVINLSVIKNGEAPIARRYKLAPAYPYSEADPLKSTAFKVSAGIPVVKDQKVQWSIESATAR